MGAKKCKRNCNYFSDNGVPKYRNLFAKGSEIFSQKRWSKIYAWECISEKILKFWSRLPEIRISYDFEVPVLPRSGDFGLPKTFLDSWTWFFRFFWVAKNFLDSWTWLQLSWLSMGVVGPVGSNPGTSFDKLNLSMVVLAPLFIAFYGGGASSWLQSWSQF